MNHDIDQYLIPYQTAEEQALAWIKKKTLDYDSSERALDKRLAIFRSDVLNQLDEELIIVKNDYLAKIGALGGYQQAKNKEYLIRSGSIKQLI